MPFELENVNDELSDAETIHKLSKRQLCGKISFEFISGQFIHSNIAEGAAGMM